MYIDINTIKNTAALISALGVIGGFLWAFFRWVNKQKETSLRVDKLEEKEANDIKELEKKHIEDNERTQGELCMLNYAILASLDALCQKGYKGKVQEAHDKLSKRLNQQAHDQV